MSPSQVLEDLTLDYQQIASVHMRQLFADDPFRFQRFSLEAAGLMLDYSKNRITEKTFNHLISFAESLNLSDRIEDLFSGQFVNPSENRPALHTALRAINGEGPLYLDQTNISEAIKETLKTMEGWVDRLLHHHWLGYNQKPITHVVHIGIGGSHLGPLMVNEALTKHRNAPECHFVSSVDSLELDTLLAKLNPEVTLFIIASKTFTTQETLATANRAKTWLLQSAGTQDISQQLVATTAHVENARAYGILPDLILPLWNWVGGRYSVWSAIGLPIAIHTGMSHFKQLLAGAHLMDQHFRTAPYNTNMPVILALLSFWYVYFFKVAHHAILPYDYRLRSLPRYMQQLTMESNGKQVQKDGASVNTLTAPVTFGEIGTNGQHSFHQLLFQGTHLIPCDFIAPLKTTATQEDRAILLAHCLAQSRALMVGKSTEETYNELLQKNYPPEQAQGLAPHQAVLGNQPSNTILISEFNPKTLGALMALYEHKTYVEGVLWNINSFDQWGVELGKEIAKEVLESLQDKNRGDHYDASTRGLLCFIKNKC